MWQMKKKIFFHLRFPESFIGLKKGCAYMRNYLSYEYFEFSHIDCNENFFSFTICESIYSNFLCSNDKRKESK